MAIKTVMSAYASPVGSTKKVTVAVAAGIAEVLGAKLREFNWTIKKNREWRLEFTPSDLLVVGAPTYAGRLPNKLMPYVRDNLLVDRELAAARDAALSATANTAQADTTDPAADAAAHSAQTDAKIVFAVPVVTYGGRAFDNSLSEAAGLLQKNGFAVAGGAAFPCEHVFSDLLQKGRPTEDDLALAREFGRAVGEKILAFQQTAGEGVTDAGAENAAGTAAACKTNDAAGAADDTGAAAFGNVAAAARWNEPVLPGDYTPAAYYQPRDLDGNPTEFLKAGPVLLKDRCIGCGKCQSVCPVESVHMEKCTPKAPAGKPGNGLSAGMADKAADPLAGGNPLMPGGVNPLMPGGMNPLMPGGTNPLAAMKLQYPVWQGVCIKCQACVKTCPQGAWVFKDEAFLRHVAMLEQTFGGEAREIEFFL